MRTASASRTHDRHGNDDAFRRERAPSALQPLRIAALLAVVHLAGFAAGAPLRNVTPDECRYEVRDFTYRFWQHGTPATARPTRYRPERARATNTPHVLCVRTGWYGFGLDVERMHACHLGGFQRAQGYEDAPADRGEAVFSLPPRRLVLAVEHAGRTYACVGPDLARWSNPRQFPVRLVNAGRFVQRSDVLDLRFRDDQGATLAVVGRLEITAWPDVLSLLLEVRAETAALKGARLRVSLEEPDASEPGRPLVREAEVAQLPAGGSASVALLLRFDPDPALYEEASPTEVRGFDTATGKTLATRYDRELACHRIGLPAPSWDLNTEPNRLERVRLTLANPSDRERPVRLFFEKRARDLTGIWCFVPMLRDLAGHPTGVQVQLSKNMHRFREGARPAPPAPYEGSWFHLFAMLRLPAHSRLECEFCITYLKWGRTFTVSHAQMSLIGWGYNTLWDPVSLAGLIDTPVYSLDAVMNRSAINDVRPILTWGQTWDKSSLGKAKGVKWGFSRHVGGGDFLAYYDQAGEYQFLKRIHTRYDSHGPNLTDVTYSAVTMDGTIAATIRVLAPATDDYSRFFQHIRYDVLRPVRFGRLAFYQMGADTNQRLPFTLLARGDRSGLLEEWDVELDETAKTRSGIACEGHDSWFSMHGVPPSTTRLTSGDKKCAYPGALGSRGLIIRRFDAVLGGKPCAQPFASIRPTNAPHIASALLELTPPPGLEQLRPGDYVEAFLEVITFPIANDDYYGPNARLVEVLKESANTWRPVFREVTCNNLAIHVHAGTCLHKYPLVIQVSPGQRCDLEITGGAGWVPITFAGLTSYKGYELLQIDDRGRRLIDHSVHGNDFWQTDYDARTDTFSRTYSVPLEKLAGEKGRVRLELKRTEREGRTEP